MLDLYDLGDGQVTQLKVALAKFGERIERLERQKTDIDRVVAELTRASDVDEGEARRARSTTNVDRRSPRPEIDRRRRIMPTYKAPVEDVQFLLNDVFHIERYGNLPGFADASPDVVAAILRGSRQVRRGSVAAAQSRRRPRRLQAPRRRQRHHAERLQGSLQAVCRRRLDGHLGAGRIWRAGPARHDDRDRQRDSRRRQHGVLDVSGPDAGRDRGAAACTASPSRRRSICRT